MPGCLAYFCAEWRRARRLVRLDCEALYELPANIGSNGEVLHGSFLARHHDLAGWNVDLDDAAVVHNMPAPDAFADLAGNSVGSNPWPVVNATSNVGASAAAGSGPSPPGSSSGTRRPRPGNSPWQSSSQTFGSPRNLSRSRVLSSTEERINPAPAPVLFVNLSHPLAGMRDQKDKEEFVQDVRRRLCAERFFASSGHTSTKEEPLMSVEEAEDVFEALLLLQQRHGATSAELRLDRAMDALVDSFFAQSRFRQLIDRAATSLLDFFQRLDLDKNGHVEGFELHHFIKNAEGGIGDLTGTVDRLFSCLDCNKDGKVEEWELRRLSALVAPPCLSLTEFVGHFEIKYGLGRSGFSTNVDRTGLFERLWRTERLDLSPEDAVVCFRAIGAGKNGMLSPASFDSFVRQMPIEANWGVDPFYADQAYNALGVRALVLERSTKQDACLPWEAVLERCELLPEHAELEEAFNRMWDRYMSAASSHLSSTAVQQLREACFRRFSETARASWERRKAMQMKSRVVGGPCSLFPNIGDVLAVASTRLYSGQVCVVRYRLLGASNFWHPEHTVLKNERESCPWPVKQALLGCTPFIGLVPAGQTSPTTLKVEPSYRVDLPRDRDSGLPLLYGYVELIAPSLERKSRTQCGASVAEDFELRLFCSTKHKVIGCIGEPVMVTVLRKVLPPPLEAIQVRCEGRLATLRWGRLDVGIDAQRGVIEAVRLNMHSEKTDRCFILDPDCTEYEIPNLVPDTEYEFRARLENRTGPGREVAVTCRTNSCCSAPGMMTVHALSTAHVELRWMAPKVIGNETTKDRFQQHRDRILRYEATLRVEEDADKGKDMGWDDGIDFGHVASLASVSTNTRTCTWLAGQWKEDQHGNVTVKLASLRPDTRYELEGLCAVNSMGPGATTKALVFWTIPQMPEIASVRVKHGLVLIALLQTGGINVKEYSISVGLAGKHAEKETYTLPLSNLSTKNDGQSIYPELSLRFEKMPAATESSQMHIFEVKARNEGGWSEPSKATQSLAVARQQGAEKAQEKLIKAIEMRRIDTLSQILHDVRDIELPDESRRGEGRALLDLLQARRDELTHAMDARDPTPLRLALERAREVELPDVASAVGLLKMLEAKVVAMDVAKGIDQLQAALRDAREAGLPDELLKPAMERLAAREAAESQGLRVAMQGKRVPDLIKALDAAAGMNLPSEEAARKLLSQLNKSESLLQAGLKSRRIIDLTKALKHARESGLNEVRLISECESLFAALKRKQEIAHSHLRVCFGERHPIHLNAALCAAREAQVEEADLVESDRLLAELESLVQQNLDATGTEQRKNALVAARAAQMPEELLVAAEEQLRRLRFLHTALDRGCVEQLRRTLFKAESAGVKEVELAEAKLVYAEWDAADAEIEMSKTCCQTERLGQAIASAKRIGIADDQLVNEVKQHTAMKRRDVAESGLEETVKSREFENLEKAIALACEEEVDKIQLLAQAKCLLERLYMLRKHMAAALERGELITLFNALETVSEAPALPEQELQPLRKALSDLQGAEFEYLCKEFRNRTDNVEWRAVDALLHRRERAKLGGVTLGETLPQRGRTMAKQIQDAEQQEFEAQLQCERTFRDYPHWKDDLPKSADRVPLPLASVIGEIELLYEPSGVSFCILPREIVEFTIIVRMGETPSQMDGASPFGEGKRTAEQLIRCLRRLLPPEDDVLQLENPSVTDGEGVVLDQASMHLVADGRLDINMTIYVRAPHSGRDITEAIVARSDLGDDLWREDQEMKHEHGDVQSLAADLSSFVSQTITERVSASLPPPQQEQPKCLANYVRNVRSRMLRRVTLDLSWYYPKGLLDTLDATCFAFDKESLLEVIDYRGYHGGKYGRPPSGLHKVLPHGVDNTGGAVKYGGDSLDNKRRRGKQIMNLRLDEIPAMITDLVFVLSACNSRDLSKFSEITVTVYDTDTSAVLGTFQAQPVQSDDALIMCNIFRLEDGLWRANSFGAPCKGTSRDYRPIFTKLNELGFPRNVYMRQQVPPILESIQRNLRVEPAVKATSIKVSSAHALSLNYAVELFGSVAQKGHNLANQVGKLSFHRELVKSLRSANVSEVDGQGTKAGDQRFAEKHLIVNPASAKTLYHLEVQLCFGYPADKLYHDFQLDGTCACFEEKGLREVVDYRGPHGIRIVHNGVLDYSGIWIGKLGVSDATGGSIVHVGENMDDAGLKGRHSLHVHFDMLPKSVSDLFFTLSSPFGYDISTYKDVSVRVIDFENPGHEITRSTTTPQSDSKAVVMCSMSVDPKSKEGSWFVETHGSKTKGNCIDYRPMLLNLRAIQEKRYQQMAQWPFKVMDMKGQEFGKLVGQDPSGKGVRLEPRLADVAGSEYRLPKVQDMEKTPTKQQNEEESSRKWQRSATMDAVSASNIASVGETPRSIIKRLSLFSNSSSKPSRDLSLKETHELEQVQEEKRSEGSNGSKEQSEPGEPREQRKKTRTASKGSKISKVSGSQTSEALTGGSGSPSTARKVGRAVTLDSNSKKSCKSQTDNKSNNPSEEQSSEVSRPRSRCSSWTDQEQTVPFNHSIFISDDAGEPGSPEDLSNNDASPRGSSSKGFRGSLLAAINLGRSSVGSRNSGTSEAVEPQRPAGRRSLMPNMISMLSADSGRKDGRSYSGTSGKSGRSE